MKTLFASIRSCKVGGKMGYRFHFDRNFVRSNLKDLSDLECSTDRRREQEDRSFVNSITGHVHTRITRGLKTRSKLLLDICESDIKNPSKLVWIYSVLQHSSHMNESLERNNSCWWVKRGNINMEKIGNVRENKRGKNTHRVWLIFVTRMLQNVENVS